MHVSIDFLVYLHFQLYMAAFHLLMITKEDSKKVFVQLKIDMNRYSMI